MRRLTRRARVERRHRTGQPPMALSRFFAGKSIVSEAP
jgi:hypothetical protein